MNVILTTLAVVLASVGAGQFVFSRLGPSRHSLADPVVAFTGLCAIVFFAGWLIAAGIYSLTAAWLLLALGSAALLLRKGPKVAPDRRRSESSRAPLLALGALSLLIASIRIISEFNLPFSHKCDDLPAYFHFPRLLLESGGFVEPFSFRRLGTMGAAQFLQSLYWPGLGIVAVNMTDAIIGQLVLWTAVRAIPREMAPETAPAWTGDALAFAALIIALAVPVWNSTPVLIPMGGAVILLLLTHRLVGRPVAQLDIPAAIGWGLTAALLVNFRISSIVFPGIIWLAGVAVAARRRDARLGTGLAVAAAAAVAAFLPWNLALLRSSATPFVALWPGNYRLPDFYSVPMAPAELAGFVAFSLWATRVWAVAGVGMLAASLRAYRVLCLSTVLALVLLVAATSVAMNGTEQAAVYRYCSIYLGAGLLFFLALIVVEPGSGPAKGHAVERLRGPALVIILAAWVLMPVEGRDFSTSALKTNALTTQVQALARLEAALVTLRTGFQPPEIPDRARYEKAQSALPPDAKVVAAVAFPFHFRFDQHVIHTLDLVGVVSPEPGLPAFEGADAVAEYLHEVGYTHLAFSPTDYGVCVYSRERISSWLESEAPYLRRVAPIILDFLGNAEQLRRTRPIAYESAPLVVIDLRPEID